MTPRGPRADEGSGVHARSWPAHWFLRAWVLLLALVVAGMVLLGDGYALLGDSVAVPTQDLLPWMWGGTDAPPRSVPQDVLVAMLDNVLPGALIQRITIFAGLVLLGLGVGNLLRGRSAFEQAAAATVAMWSTFVYERTLMGHWGLLLGVAAIPWTMRAAADLRASRPGSLTRLTAWTLLGSLVPTAGALQVAAAVLVLLWPGPESRRGAVPGVAAVVGVQLVWIIPGLRNPGQGSSAASDVFGLRAEGIAGPVLTALGTGGIWTASVVPDSRLGPMAVIAPLVLLVVAALGVSRLGFVARPIIGPLVGLSVAGLVWAILTAVPTAASAAAAVESLPGGGLLRDAQKWLAPWVILLAVAAGLGLGRVREHMRGSDAWWPGTLLLLLVPVLLLPDLAFGAWGRLAPAAYPVEWDEVRAVLAASDEQGDVVSLPWSAFRSYDWNEGRTVLDPAPRYMPRTVVTDSRLLVQDGAELLVVESDDPRSSAVGDALRAPDAPQALRELGIGWVLWQKDQPGTPGHPAVPPGELTTGSSPALDSPGLALYRLAGPVEEPGPPTWGWMIVAAWAVWGCALLVVVGGLMRGILLRHPLGERATAAESGTLRPEE